MADKKIGQADLLNINIQNGIEYTYREGMRALIDWVQFTLPVLALTDEQKEYMPEDGELRGLDHVFDLLEILESDFLEMKTGMHGYKKQKRCGHISVLYDGMANMGTHIVMTGQGCREYEQRIMLRMMDKPENTSAVFVWRELFMKVLAAGGKFTRVDGAIDDFTPHFDLLDVSHRIDKGLCSSRFDGVREIKERKISTGMMKGITLYFGSEKSDLQVVMYEKKAERENAGVEVEDDVKAWNRTEIRLYDSNTYEFVYNVVNGHDLGKLLARILANYISMLEKGRAKNELGMTVVASDSNKARWKLWRNWAKFIGGVEKLKLNHIAPDRTIEKSMGWIDAKVKKSLARIYVAEPEMTMEWLQQKIVEGAEQFNEADENMIRTYWRNKDAISQLIEHLQQKKDAAEVAAAQETIDE